MPHPNSAAAANRGRLHAFFVLTLAIFVVEAIGGFAANSLALLADAEQAPWGSKTQIRSRSASVVLVDEAAEQVPSANAS